MIPEKALNALIQIGHQARQAGWVAQSERLFQHLRDAYPLKAFPHVGIGLACIKAGRYAQASEAFEQAMQLGDGSADVYLWCGICQFRCGRLAKAAHIFQDIIEKSSSTGADGLRKLATSLLGVPELSAFRRQSISHPMRG